MAHSTYDKDAEGVGQTLHHQLIVLKIVIAYVQHLISVHIRCDKHGQDVANHDVSPRQMQHACHQPNA